MIGIGQRRLKLATSCSATKQEHEVLYLENLFYFLVIKRLIFLLKNSRCKFACSIVHLVKKWLLFTNGRICKSYYCRGWRRVANLLNLMPSRYHIKIQGQVRKSNPAPQYILGTFFFFFFFFYKCHPYLLKTMVPTPFPCPGCPGPRPSIPLPKFRRIRSKLT